MQRLTHILRLGLKGIAVHRLRAALTTLGIILGVASVIVMLAVGEAARHEAIEQIRELGATNIIVRSVKPAEDSKQQQRQWLLAYGLTTQDGERISSTIPTVVSVTPIRESRKEARYLEQKLETRAVAVMPQYLQGNGLYLSQGRFITDLDNELLHNVCVLGAETAEVLFPFSDPLGRSIHLGSGPYMGGQAFVVVGVTERRAPSAGIGGSLTAQDYNRDLYIPFHTDRARFGKIVMYHRAGTWQTEKLEISQLTVAVDEMANVKETASIIEGLLDQYHDQKDTAVTVPLDLLEKAEQTQRLFTWVLGAIALISLVVGGIGIMNIMLATVTERTREIGIRRALGAKRSDIVSQFLTETVLLSIGGGILGVASGIGLSYLPTYFFGVPTIIRLWSPVLALAVAVAFGLVFGMYPALKAARMDPIEALRHE